MENDIGVTHQPHKRISIAYIASHKMNLVLNGSAMKSARPMQVVNNGNRAVVVLNEAFH
jgi:hypothetical protein